MLEFRNSASAFRECAVTCKEPGLPAAKEVTLLSEALPVDDRWARLVVFALRDPHLLEGAQRRQNGAADPHGVFPLRWCDNFNLHRRWREGSELLGHTLANAGEHRGAP